jgi:hypothetical protein
MRDKGLVTFLDSVGWSGRVIELGEVVVEEIVCA